MTTGQDLVNWMIARLGKFAYSNDRPQKLSPDTSGESDCSGTVWAAHHACGVNLADIDMSYEMAHSGFLIASGKTWEDFAAVIPRLAPGDIIAMSIRGGYNGGKDYNHVELWTGTGFIGHGGPGKGPTLNNPQALIAMSAFWTIRRHIITPPTPTSESENEMIKILVTGREEQYLLTADGRLLHLQTLPESALSTRIATKTLTLKPTEFRTLQALTNRIRSTK